MRNCLKYFTKRDAAEMLGLSLSKFHHLLYRGQLPPPTRDGGTPIRQYYIREDIDELKKILATPREPKHVNAGDVAFVEKGFYTKTRAADYLGMPQVTFFVFLKRGRIKQPTHRFKHYNALRFYTKREVVAIKRQLQGEGYYLLRKRREVV